MVSSDAHLDPAYRSNVNTQIDQSVLGFRTLGGFTTLNAAIGLSFGQPGDGSVRHEPHRRARRDLGGFFCTGATTIRDTASENVMRPRTLGIGVDYKSE